MPLAQPRTPTDSRIAPELVSPDLIAEVTGGSIRGLREGVLRSWRGVPYAAAPVGSLRFRAPAPVVPWEDLRDATDFGPIAPQSVRRRVQAGPAFTPIDEDCLTLNVQTPLSASEVAAGTTLPVMIFIHGGGYMAGSSRDFSGQGESFTLTGRTVYVSFNYRLGPLGYLDFTRYATDEHPIDSNLGLRDQVAVLDWVRQNIAQFGGDPANVTIFGESAGGNAVTTLLGVPAARGLFARAIAQSSPPSAVFPARLAAEWAGEYLDLLREHVATVPSRSPSSSSSSSSQLRGDSAAAPSSGASDRGSSDDVLDAAPEAPRDPADLLFAADVAELLAASHGLQRTVPDLYPGTFCLAPTVDGDFLPEHPMRAVREGRGAKVPLIVGTNAREGAVFRGPLDILPTTAPRIGGMFGRAPSRSKRPMHDVYPGLPKRHDSLDFGGDYAFWYPSTLLADWHSRHAPTHAYRFDFAPRLLKLTGIDATHGVELFTLFDAFDLPLVRAMTALGGREVYAAAGQRMRSAWLQFASDGSLPSRWPAYDESARATLIIDEHDRVEQDPRRERRLAWKAFLPIFENLW
ncbi:hypothetical protein AX769_11480 [Frondihabitans sp. PAMC 28766]|uniref:carboxylesterase/lipase family protein n=1 Tax=Frondihabitans sp. PAMC 28766 TaxID=1795630 RepID=UPI00078D76C0|nr:carboxylesterase family protein [Frondihabitans sp. PAMC 28766]AMM20650.1 hypothetical protein AX769_11480 [Frondihabitans sp. PAMC 28766]